MGTYSNYHLGIIRDQYPISVREKQKIIQQMFDDPDIDPENEMIKALTNDGQTNQETKWYDFIPHLTAFSKKYPELKFVLGLSEVNDRYQRNGHHRDQRRHDIGEHAGRVMPAVHAQHQRVAGQVQQLLGRKHARATPRRAHHGQAGAIRLSK